MKLHCLGTAGYHPSETRHTACYFMPECGLMLDAGSGTFRLEKLIQHEEIHVLLSHAHLDHVLGLTFFLDLVAITPLRRIHVYAEREKIIAIEEHVFSELLFPVMPPIEWHALEDMGSEFELVGVQCRWFPLSHPGGSVGYRLDFPKFSLAYVTDTVCRDDSEYWGVIQGVDWLIHECNFSDKWIDLAIKTGHSWTSSVLKNTIKARIERLILTHINPVADDRDPVGLSKALSALPHPPPSKIVVAKDSLVIDLSSL
jgi:ribonuclease Z